MESATPAPRQWWQDAVFYQIYPRSFQDSNGDGFGDLPGIIARLPEIAALGVTAIWLSPIYPSPDADNGYDIADYCAVDPRYGTLDDFDELVAAASRLGIRIIMDLVVNHTSSQHPWFEASRRRQKPYSDYYIWRDAGPDGGPPNNWTSFFAGPVWQWDELREQYYLHLFDPRQPDLNWHDPAVMAEVKQLMRFWIDRGVAGFRCDVINILYKTSLDNGRWRPAVIGLEHYQSQAGTHAILQELQREVLSPTKAFTVGEAVMVDLDQAHDLTDPQRHELDLIFYFDNLEVDRLIANYGPKPFSAAELLRRLSHWQQGLNWTANYFENHDQPRIVSHYGDDHRYWRRSACALAILQFAQRGTPFIYQGQEIGMTDFDFSSIDQVNDTQTHGVDQLLARLHLPRAWRWRLIRSGSRDNARTPMQWTPGPGAGFTSGQPWLGINHNHSWLNYQAQLADRHSVLWFYRRLVHLRQASPTLIAGGFEPLYGDRQLLAFRRTPQTVAETTETTKVDSTYDIWVNLSGRTRRLPSTGHDQPTGEIVASSTGRRQLDGRLLAWEAVIIRLGTATDEVADGDAAAKSAGRPAGDTEAACATPISPSSAKTAEPQGETYETNC
ncbi:MAG: alpha-glucosidase [Propionibacteriaceae bacterium]|jgi:oligo-1,6-glucosidase|nr:alpha-glucosidase [Propionibacteriaceae bacterium]